MRRVWLALALALPFAAAAQPAPPPGQTGADQAINGRLRLVVESLRTAATRLSVPGPAEWDPVRRAVEEAQAMLADLPAAVGQDTSLNQAHTALSEAHNALRLPQPDRSRTAQELREAAEAMAALRPGLGTTVPQRP